MSTKINDHRTHLSQIFPCRSCWFTRQSVTAPVHRASNLDAERFCSTTGRVFKEETEKALDHFVTRRLDDLEFVAILIVGKTLREEQILLAMGLTSKGEKIILGFVEAKTESHSCVVALLQDLQERGFRAAATLLMLLDGAKGLHKGVLEVFGDQALIQRCQWYKRENVTSNIKDPDVAAETKKKWRRRMPPIL